MNYKLAAVLSLLFFVIGNPMLYDLVDRVVPVKDQSGISSQVGVFLHSLVFVLLFSMVTSSKLGKYAIKLE